MSPRPFPPRYLLRAVVSLVLLAAAVWLVGGPAAVAQGLGGLHVSWMAAALLAMTADRILMAGKWVLLLRGRGEHLPLWAGVRIYCAASMFGLFVPAPGGADAVRALMAIRRGARTDEVIASILVERIGGLLVALLLALVGILLVAGAGPLAFDPVHLFAATAGLLLAGIAAFAGSLSRGLFVRIHERWLRPVRDRRVMRRLRELHAAYVGHQVNRASLALFFALTFLEQALYCLILWLVALALGLSIGPFFLGGATCLALLLARLPVSVDGMGVFEITFVPLLGLAGVPSASALGLALTARVLQVLAHMPWWLAHLMSSGSDRGPSGPDSPPPLTAPPPPAGRSAPPAP